MGVVSLAWTTEAEAFELGALVKAGGGVERAVWDGAYGADGDEMRAGWGEWKGFGDGWVVGVQGEVEGCGFGDEKALVGTAGACGEKEGGF